MVRGNWTRGLVSAFRIFPEGFPFLCESNQLVVAGCWNCCCITSTLLPICIFKAELFNWYKDFVSGIGTFVTLNNLSYATLVSDFFRCCYYCRNLWIRWNSRRGRFNSQGAFLYISGTLCYYYPIRSEYLQTIRKMESQGGSIFFYDTSEFRTMR